MGQPSGIVSAQTTAELREVWVSKLGDGSLGYVVSDDQMYVLNKSIGGAVVGSLTPLSGAPIAGFPDARWLIAFPPLG